MTVREIPAELAIDPKTVTAHIEEFIRLVMTRSNHEKVVIGLSGGVDSAVSAALCARALGTKNVRAILMPFETSAKESFRDAMAVANCIGLKTETMEITPMAAPYIEAEQPGQLRTGNILARLRMIVLFDMAKKHESLVAGTSNKTETYFGYCTWYGDAACSFQPIADLYKSQVWQIAEWLELPQAVLEKAPSADLWPGQTDEGEMGITYAEADLLLTALLDRGMHPGALVKEGFSEQLVRKVVNTIRTTQYKRQMPPVAYLPGHDVDIDYLLAPEYDVEAEL